MLPVVLKLYCTPHQQFREGMTPNELGLLSEVASSLDPPPVDPSLIDPSLLPQHEPSTSSHSIPQHSILPPAQPTRNGWNGDIPIGEFQVGSSSSTRGGAHSKRMEIDPSLQSLSNDLQLSFSGLYHAPSRHSASPSLDQEEEEGDSQDSEGEGDYQLLQTPKDVNEQILELRDMDDQATKTLEENSKYQTELNRLMERFQKASKRTTELKVRLSFSFSLLETEYALMGQERELRRSSRVCRRNYWPGQI